MSNNDSMQIDKPLCFAIQNLADQINYLKIVNSSDFALRATTGQEGWGRFCHVVYPTGKPEDFRSCVVKGSM
jgi:hypothetical protein